MNPRIRLIPPAVLAIWIFALYHGALHYPFQFDDYAGIVDNPDIENLADIWRIASHNPSRFVHYLSLAFNRHFGGLDTFGYHLFNVCVHVAAATAFYFFIGLLFRAGARMTGFAPDPLLSLACQASAALAWAAHPLQTQAVTFIWQRSASMAALLYVGSMALYLKSAIDELDGKSQGRWRASLAGAWVLALLAMLTKQFSVTLPVALVLLDYLLISGTVESLKKRAARLGPFVPLILVIPAFTTLVNKGEVGDLGDRAANLLTPYRYLITELNVIVHYLGLLLYPANQNLDYDFPIPAGFADSAVSFFILAALAALGLFLRAKNPAASFGILFFFLAMSVESSFYPLEDPVFEHRMYLPMTGLFAAFASLEMALLTRAAPARYQAAIAGALALAMALPLSAATVLRNRVWSSHESLWEDVVAKSPRKARGYNNLAVALVARGETDRALDLLHKAAEVEPKFVTTYLNLAMINEHRGNLKEALVNYLQVVKRDPTLQDAPYRLGSVLYQLQQYEKAAKYFLMAISINSRHMNARMELGVSLAMAGKLEVATAVFSDIIKMEPSNGQAHYNLAMAYLTRGDKGKAKELFAKAKQLGYLEPAPAL